MEGHLSPDFASSKKNHRTLIRLSLFKKMFQMTNQTFPESLNLSKPPLKFKNYFISISHSKKAGAYWIAPNTPIGFDMEDTSRCKKHLYKKILSDNEEKSIEVSTLWTLKEASVKSLSFLQKKIFLKDILVRPHKNSSKIFYIKFKNILGKGFVAKNFSSTMALVKINSFNPNEKRIPLIQ